MALPVTDGAGLLWTVTVYLWKERKGLWGACSPSAKSQCIIGTDFFHMYQQKQRCFHGRWKRPFLWSYFLFVYSSRVSTGFIILCVKQTQKRKSQKIGIGKDLRRNYLYVFHGKEIGCFPPFLSQNKINLSELCWTQTLGVAEAPKCLIAVNES